MAGSEYSFRDKAHAGRIERPAAPMGKKGGQVLGSLRRMEIEPAENGVTITHYHNTPRGNGKGPEPMMHEGPKPFVFTSHEEAAKHVKEHLARHAKGHMMNSNGTYDDEMEEPKG